MANFANSRLDLISHFASTGARRLISSSQFSTTMSAGIDIHVAKVGLFWAHVGRCANDVGVGGKVALDAFFAIISENFTFLAR
ncbi:hypothetical protein ACFL5F_07325 [Planctomycetota bacterium]